MTEFDEDLDALIEDLCDTLKSAGGIGLSATQINQHHRVLVIVPVHGQDAPHTYVNHEIKSKAAWGLVEQSSPIRAGKIRQCLSRNKDSGHRPR